VTPVHLSLSTVRANCSAYNIAEAQKDRENAIVKIHNQVEHINNIRSNFIKGYTTGDLTKPEELNEDVTPVKSSTMKIESEIDKISDLSELKKVIKMALNRGVAINALPSQTVIDIFNLL